MDDERKFVKTTLTVGESPWGFGNITGKFKAERFPGSPLLDTNVELEIKPFCITWEAKEKLLEELSQVIAKYQI